MSVPGLQPVTRQSVPDAVATQLQTQILDGHLIAGGDLPGERALADALGVSRPTIREALRQLQQRGLVEIRQGGATTVRDFRRSAGLDLLPQLLQRGGHLNLDLVADIMRARSAIGPQIARAAAQAVAADQERPHRDVALAAAEVVAGAEGAIDQQHAALAFWEAVVDLSGSMVYRLLFNGLRRAYEPVIDAFGQVMAAEVGQAASYRALARTIDAGHAEGAQEAATRVLAPGLEAVHGLIAGLRTADPHAQHADARSSA